LAVERIFGRRAGAWLGALFVAGTLAVTGGASGAPAPATPPGTAAQVKALVAASVKITTADSAILAQLPSALADNWATEFSIPAGTACETATQCVYGDTSGSQTVVLYGDSHARQWLPALNLVAVAYGWRIVLLGQDGCPMVSVTFSGKRYPNCAAVASASISTMLSMRPQMIILADSTYDTTFSAAAWKAGMTKTFTTLQPSGAQLIVMQDDQEFTEGPAMCVAAYPTNIQAKCSVANPNRAMPLLASSEQAAAKTAGVPYILTNQWFCTAKRCSPVIGDFLAHFDRGHITASYSTYLSGVLGTSLKPYFTK
jgi:hypothetical protein